MMARLNKPHMSSAQCASSTMPTGAAAGAQNSTELQPDFEVYANWRAILIALFLFPWFCLLFLNPITIFVVLFLSFQALILSFLPKVAFFLLLEMAIAQGRGAEWFEHFYSRTLRSERGWKPPAIRAVPAFIQWMVVEYASLFGGVERTARQQVAAALKRYGGGRPSVLQAGRRACGLVVTVALQARLHFHFISAATSRFALRFYTRNVLAILFVKRPRTWR
mmetsp:Transcript_54507/g.127466  ORF Transcript_54507/g.127466 Transcript_54507/m.127466 type:complete len:222 (-) Transcript_54507:48-713(-)